MISHDIGKVQDGADGAPILTFTIANIQLLFRHTATGATLEDVEVLASTSWSHVLDHWLDVTITVENTESGKLETILKDAASGITLMSYSGTELAKAAAATLQRRLENGGRHTDWSSAWIVNMFARLEDGEQS